jgi:methionyl-tRNA formyltransferase
MGGAAPVGGLDIVAFNAHPVAYGFLADWAAARGHRLRLVVTVPAEDTLRYGTGPGGLVAALPPGQDVLVTRRLKATAAPTIAALAPDLIISATFPRRIPPEVTAIPRFGAVNLHPAPLPRGRGPNPIRLLYEGDLTAAASLHRIAPDFDAGPVLAQHARRLPDAVTPEDVRAAWSDLLLAALDEGVARAVAGDPGEPQDETRATYAAPFTEAERLLSWHEPALTIQRRAAALNALAPSARARLGDDEVAVPVLAVRARPGVGPDVAPGTVLERGAGVVAVRVADGVVEVEVDTAPPGRA